MVKGAKTAKRMGRPPKDIGDLRTERIAMRAHPDLLSHLNDLARRAGIVRSVYGEEVLDPIGREIPPYGPKGSDSPKAMGPRPENRRVLRDDVMPATASPHVPHFFKRR
jgi:hypothetical protein